MEQNFMQIAVELAKKAQKKGEVPIGAVIVRGNKVISHAYNLRERKKNALYHAETLAIDKACSKLHSWRLDDCDIYVTLQPCLMCAGAILNSRIERLVFGAFDPKGGAAGTIVNLLEDARFNHKVEIISGVLEEDCKEILQSFFKSLRK